MTDFMENFDTKGRGWLSWLYGNLQEKKQWLWQFHALHSEEALPVEFDKNSVVIFHTELFGIFVN